MVPWKINRLIELKKSLISGLPNDVARHCLAKVPRVYHRSMRSVSTTWRKTVESEDFLAVRRKNGISGLVVILMENGHNSYCIYNLPSKSKAPLPDPLPTGLEIGGAIRHIQDRGGGHSPRRAGIQDELSPLDCGEPHPDLRFHREQLAADCRAVAVRYGDSEWELRPRR
ncbi:hypothetical protein SELMODRAFT_410670 [Selaginella moellendorffii]|uniref:F-box domain-containing protein n=1 Tax=Selaginella moellendorffii TaxID=88036 RepID=D8RFH1_SELML|nr:hypothetical protein SELMODRAFT_410670 [Selaginella moellendorffii]